MRNVVEDVATMYKERERNKTRGKSAVLAERIPQLSRGHPLRHIHHTCQWTTVLYLPHTDSTMTFRGPAG